MEILSVTNKRTQLHKSPLDLSTVCSHEHNQKLNISSDVSFFASNLSPKCFAQVFKSDVVEIWRIKTNNDGVETLDRVRKIKFEGVQAIVCGKLKEAPPEFAVGYTTGQIRILELNNQNTRKAEFAADPKNKVSVVSLDYSSCGAYLSSVYENGIINIFGLTTKIKSETIQLGKDSSLARFHPVKRFLLGVASFKGHVHMYDIAAKKISFSEKFAHDAPCLDIAFAEEVPERLYTCGCDTLIKIFDTRKISTGTQIKTQCGLNTISASRCGGFFAVGNLKGEILTYDMRSLRQPLAKIKVDSELVTRIEFVPAYGENVAKFPTMCHRDSVGSTMSDDLPPVTTPQDDYTMDDIIDFQKNRVSDFAMSCTSRVSSRGDHEGGRISDAFGSKLANALKDLSFSEDLSFEDGQLTPEVDERNVNFERLSKRFSGKRDSVTKRRSSLLPPPLQLIHEEKENTSNNLNAHTPTGVPRFSSTPVTSLKFNIKETVVESSLKSSIKETPLVGEISYEEPIDVDAPDSRNNGKEVVDSSFKPTATSCTSVPPVNPQLSVDLKKEFEAIHEKIHFEVQSLNFDQSGRHMEMMTYIFNQRRQLQSRVQMIEECMSMLLNDDFKINRIMELQEENRDLRQQLDSVLRKLNQ